VLIANRHRHAKHVPAPSFRPPRRSRLRRRRVRSARPGIGAAKR
jgi:hypothetical protein